MTIHHSSAGPPDAGPPSAADAVRAAVADLLACVSSPPDVLRVRGTEFSVELEWIDPNGARNVPVRQADQEPPAGNPGEPDPELVAAYLVSPSVGVFYRGPEPGADPFIDVGTYVEAGQQIGIVEVMKLMIPVEADRAGWVVEVMKADAEPVEYGEPLVALADPGRGMG